MEISITSICKTCEKEFEGTSSHCERCRLITCDNTYCKRLVPDGAICKYCRDHCYYCGIEHNNETSHYCDLCSNEIKFRCNQLNPKDIQDMECPIYAKELGLKIRDAYIKAGCLHSEIRTHGKCYDIASDDIIRMNMIKRAHKFLTIYDGIKAKEFMKKIDKREEKNIKLKKAKSNKILENAPPADLITLYLDKLFTGNIDDGTFSMLFTLKYPNDFIYDSNNSAWYSINKYGIYKRESQELLSARKILIKDFISFIETSFMDEYKTIEDKKKSELLKNQSKTLKYLNTTYNIEALIKHIKVHYSKDDIFEKFDSINPYVVAFNNGVYDLKTKTFRNALPEEYILTTTGYDYMPAKQEYVDNINKMLAEILPTEGTRKYVLQTLAMRLRGINGQEEYYIWIGDSRNGKGIIMKLMNLTMGNYHGEIDIDFFTQSKHGVSASAATPQLAQNKASRIVQVDEPGDSVKLRIEKLKQISGGDKIVTRYLYQQPFSYIAQYCLFFLTNKKPIIDGSDQGSCERIKYIYFPMRFVADPDPSKPNERKVDITLKEKFVKDNEYRYAFFQILLNNYYEVIDNDPTGKIIVPEDIKKDTMSYLDENNPVKGFINNCVEITKNVSDKISSSDLYSKFCEYCDCENTVNVQQFKTSLLKYDGIGCVRSNGTKYTGIKLKEDPEE